MSSPTARSTATSAVARWPTPAQLSETIISIDDDHRRVAYTITDSPFPITAHAASMQVSDAGAGKSTFQWITDVKPDELADALEPVFAGEVSKLEQRFGT